MSAKRDFEESYRAWAARPPALTAQDVSERLASQQPRTGAALLRPALVVVLLLAAFVSGATWWLQRESRIRTGAGTGQTLVERRQPEADSDDVVVVWVDDQTPVSVFLTEAGARGTK